MRKLTLMFLLLTLVSYQPQGLAQEDGQDVDMAALIKLKRLEVAVSRILAIPTQMGTARHARKQMALKKVINRAFDFKMLGRLSLGKHWEGQPRPKLDRFVDLLHRLIEKNYLLQIASQTSYEIFWTRFEVKDNIAEVEVKIKSGQYRIDLTWSMHKEEEEWFVYDMVIDDVSLINNYRSQFNRIISRKGFDELLEKMENKLNDEDGEIKDLGLDEEN
jgi:phospholipid transport system substrate-binding protein